MPEWIQCIELTRLNQVLLTYVVLESQVLKVTSNRKAHGAERKASRTESSGFQRYALCTMRFAEAKDRLASGKFI